MARRISAAKQILNDRSMKVVEIANYSHSRAICRGEKFFTNRAGSRYTTPVSGE
jgi:hypothetical protein